MKKRTLLTGLALAAATAVTAIAPAAPAGARGNTVSSSTIADVLLADSAKDGADGFDRRWHDYDIVTQAVLLFPDLVAAASDPAASLTVLAPTDEAFRRLVKDLTGTWYRSEADVFAAVAALGTDTVKAVLTYHIVGSKVGLGAVLASDNQAIPTLGGGTFTIEVRSKRWVFVEFVDNDPNARNPYLTKVNVGGSELSNGFIHGIDRVLRPTDL